MPDNETSLDIVIRTRAELEGAQSVESQLDRDINKARELGREYASQEGRGLPSPQAPQPEPATSDAAESESQFAGPDADASAAPAGSPPVSIPQAQEFQPFDARSVEAQTQSIQEAGEKMRAAFAQNGEMTIALLNRTLELIEGQTRKLEDMDRQLGQLAGRMKGLQNP
jgi:hypothetical protein